MLVWQEICYYLYTTFIGRVVAVDWVVPKTQYEEAKLASVQDSDVDDSDEVQSSCSSDAQNSDKEQSDQEGQASDDDDVVSEDDIATCSDAEKSDEPMSKQSEDEEKEENTEDKLITSDHKRKWTNDVAEGRTIFIRCVCNHLWCIVKYIVMVCLVCVYRNLSFDTDEDDLYDMFSEFGDISYCKIVINQQTQLSKGTGFIQFKSNEAAQSCITAANRIDGKVSIMKYQGVIYLPT